jgi:hypothetical protein
MELWQMDVMGGVKLQDGHELKIITGIDDHSRFCVCARLAARATAHPVCEALAASMRRHGVPEQILTDNGKVFSNRFGIVRGEVLFDRICRENGVKHLLTAPHSPTTTGKVERFHKTIRREFLEDRIFASQEEAQAELDAWTQSYNTERPHQGIGMVPPARRFALAVGEVRSVAMVELEQEADSFEQAEPDRHRVQRIVSETGRIRLVGFHYHVGRYLAGEMVEAEISGDGLVSIFHREVLVATHARKHLPEKEPDAWKKQPKARRSPRQSERTRRLRQSSGQASEAEGLLDLKQLTLLLKGNV